MMHAKVQKWGNSLALRIPNTFAKDAHLTPGSDVDLSFHNGKIVVDPDPGPQYSLSALLKGITSKNRHSEIDTGSAVGREVW